MNKSIILVIIKLLKPMNNIIKLVIIKLLKLIKKRILVKQDAAHQAHTSFAVCCKVNFIGNII